MQSFDVFKSAVESKVAGIASKMSDLYSQRCTTQTAQCSTKSFSECQGTDNYQCLNTFPKKSECLNPGISVSKSSGVRLPNSISFDSLSNQEKLQVCASAMLDETFKTTKLSLLDKVGRIYIGTSFGMFRGYPGLHQDSDNGACTKDYDPRFRPWYVSATSGSKNLILIIDVSGSMQGTPLQIAKNAAKSVIDTLGLGDFVGVIVFSTSADYLVFQSVKRATSYVKENLKSAIDYLVAQGSTNYQASFAKAQQMFKLAQNDEYGTQCPNATNVVLFLTDGTPTTGETTAQGLINQINQWNGQFNIKLFSYGIGEAYTLEILRKISCRYQGIVFEIRDLTSSSYLLNTMRSYYIYLTQGLNITQPVWSEPYDDFTTGARMVTASMPIYHTQNSIKVVVGVAGIDVTLASLQSFGISEKQISIRLLKSTPCLTLSLDACQLQNLRPSSVKCSIPNCSNPEPIDPCPFNVYTSIIKAPETSHKPLEQCCGLTIGALVGIVIGSVVGAIILATIIYCCYRKSKLARQAQRNQQSEQKPKSGQDLIQRKDVYPNYFTQEMQNPYKNK